MKKLLVISALLWISILFVGCGKKDSKTDEKTNETPEVVAVSETTVNNEICTNNSWVLTNREERPEMEICLFDDETFCFIEDLESWKCEKWILPLKDEEEVDNSEENSAYSECDKLGENIVCWKDWETYLNKCFLDISWVEEETELAHVENGECIFG